jgi:phage shock protein PspC (stress-responsive transcriptional regulator)
MTKKVKRFYRASEKDSMIGGVCAGLADYFNIDVTLIRVMWAALCFAYGFGILLYLLFWAIAPRNSR